MRRPSVRDIAEIIDHKTLQMAMRYSHLTEKHSASVVRVMNEKMGFPKHFRMKVSFRPSHLILLDQKQ